MKKERHTRKRLITKLQETAEKLGHTPTCQELGKLFKDGQIKASWPAYQYYFGTYNKAVRKAKLPINKISKHGSRKKLLEDLKEIYDDLGRVPTTDELKDFHTKGKIASRYSFIDHFGSLKNAYQKAGIDLAQEKLKTFEKKRTLLLEQLRRLPLEDKQQLTITKVKELHKRGKISCPATLYRYFGGLNKTAGIIGCTPVKVRKYQTEYLLDILRKEFKFTGQLPTWNYFYEMSKLNLLPSPSTYRYRFGSWNKAAKKAGLC